MGPITLFDKSFLEMLSADQAALFDALFSTVICPIFYSEVLADLEKPVKGGRTVEKVVHDIARKTPVMHSAPNMLHVNICHAELNGHPVEMRRVPVLPGGVPVKTSDGIGVVYEESSESKAFNRWQQGRFHELERDFASDWRAQLQSSHHADAAKVVKAVLRIQETPRNLKEAFDIANRAVEGHGQRYITLKTAYKLLGLPEKNFELVLKKWKIAGGPPLTAFAPYTAHCMTVDIFFHVAADKKLISPDRSSNRVDMAYLYYLPFCMAFVSNDKLHKRCAPLFLAENQLFIDGEELKRDLMSLDDHYSSLSEQEREQGIFRLAAYPPDDDKYLTTRIWKKFKMATSRSRSATPSNAISSKELLEKVANLQDKARQISAKGSRLNFSDPDQVVIERRIPLQIGKWKTMPPGVKAENEE